MEKTACSIDGCNRPSRKRTWCEGHYYHYKTKGTPHGPRKRAQTPECLTEGCSAKPIAKDMCKKHYYEKYWKDRGGRPKSRYVPRVYQYNSISEALATDSKFCHVEGCGDRSQARDLCGKHYQRWRRFGDPTFYPPEMPRRCTVDDCPNVSNARGMCSGHYRRWQLHGDPKLTMHKSSIAVPGDRVCTFAGCNRRLSSSGLCSLHYGRMKRHGDPSIKSRPCVRICATCGSSFDPGCGRSRKYCGKLCKPSGRIAGSVNKRSWVEKIGNEENWTCWLCELPVDRKLYWPNPQAGSVDHVIPVIHGGTDERSNLRLAHVTCNCSRSKPRRMT